MAGHLAMLDVQEAVYALLRADSTFVGLVTGGPFSPAPQNQPYPYCTFGAHVESPRLTFGKLGQDIIFVLDVWSRTTSFLEAFTIGDRIMQLLNGIQLSLTNFSNIIVIHDQTMKLDDPDGLTRHLAIRFRVWNAGV
jgi:hypothetical protein